SGVVSGEAVVGNVEGRVAIIIDDLISTGGTILRAARACRAKGATRVFAAASHGIFVGDAARLLTEPVVDGLAVTDTIPPFRIDAGLAQRKLVLLETAPLLAEAIRRIHEGGSIVELLASGA
ncbi:MAG: ribose-phosphate pyrophosphokinase, partial [Betaproteobacteria bacterium]|nr:ribose-phosphate pyrophosphokinase [Betaproteobacteria bacterium]